MGGKTFGTLLDTLVHTIGSHQVKPNYPFDDESHALDDSSSALGEGLHHATRADVWRSRPKTAAPVESRAQDEFPEYVPTVAEYFGIENPLVVFVTPSYKDELPNNAMIGEIGSMQAIAQLRKPDGSQAIEIARWIPSGLNDLEGRLISLDPLAVTREHGLNLDVASTKRELHIRTDIDRVISVVVRFPISEAQFAQVQTVFCTYGQPRMVADFSNAGLYMDMRYGPSQRERLTFGASAVTKPYSLQVLNQFDIVRVPTQRIADAIKRELRGAA